MEVSGANMGAGQDGGPPAQRGDVGDGSDPLSQPLISFGEEEEAKEPV